MKAGWVGLNINLADVRCSLVEDVSEAPSFLEARRDNLGRSAGEKSGLGIWNARISEDRLARYIALLFTSGSDIFDEDLYRLINIQGFPNDIMVSFGLDSFFGYRYGVGLMMEELTLALIESDLKIERVVENKEDLLPLREYFLPNATRFADYASRFCAGGVQVTFAMASDEGDFRVPVATRSMRVGEGQGLTSVIPMAFHQPMIDADFELPLRKSVDRELFEELFGGEEIARSVKHNDPEWYVKKSPPIRWLREHEDVVQARCTCFTLNLLAGNHDFGILLVVDDPTFLGAFSDMEHNWETLRQRGKRAITLHSSRELDTLTHSIRNSPWASQGLASLVEGFTLLKTLQPQRVSELSFHRELER